MGNSTCGAQGATDAQARPRPRAAPTTPNTTLDIQVAATEILRVAGVSAYHTSVVLGGREYYFDSQGIVTAPAFWSHAVGRAHRGGDLHTEVLHAGRSSSSGSALVQHLVPFFERGSYDVLCKNCNVFTDAALYFLTRRRLDSRFCRLERLLLSTRPLSTSLLNALIWATTASRPRDSKHRATPRCEQSGPDGRPCAPQQQQPRGAEGGRPANDGERRWPKGYCMNPRASNFSIQDVIASCDSLDMHDGVVRGSAAGTILGHPRPACDFLPFTPCCGALPAEAGAGEGPILVECDSKGQYGFPLAPYPYEAPLEARPVAPCQGPVRRGSGGGLAGAGGWHAAAPMAMPIGPCPSRPQEDSGPPENGFPSLQENDEEECRIAKMVWQASLPISAPAPALRPSSLVVPFGDDEEDATPPRRERHEPLRARALGQAVPATGGSAVLCL